MASRWSLFILFLSLLYMFNLQECEGRDLPQRSVSESLDDTEIKPDKLPELPFGISEAFNDASNIFGNFMGKILSKKKFLGLETFYEKD